MGELSYDDSLKLAEGEEEEPATSYAPVLAVSAVALFVLLGIAYITFKRPSTPAA